MSESKYPYIADKKLYAAVMGVTRWMHEEGGYMRNKAISYYADKYGVNEDDIAAELAKRQSAGQRRKNAHKPPRKYHWYAVEYSIGGERNGCDYFVQEWAEFSIRKATSESNAAGQLMEKFDDYSEYGAWCYFGRIEEFDSKDDAAKRIEIWQQERERQ